MATLGQKFRTGFLTLMHGLADKVIDLDSVGAVKQHIRDLEEGVKDIRAAEAASIADVTLAKGEITDLERQIAKTDAQIEQLDSDGDATNDVHIAPLETRLMGYEQQRDAKREELVALTETSNGIRAASARLHDQLVSMRRQVTTLESQARAAGAKKKAADALENAAETLSSTDTTASVDSLSRKIKRDNAVADERLKQALGAVAGDSADDAVAASEVSARLTERRARRAAKNGAASVPGPTKVGSPAAVVGGTEPLVE